MATHSQRRRAAHCDPQGHGLRRLCKQALWVSKPSCELDCLVSKYQHAAAVVRRSRTLQMTWLLRVSTRDTDVKVHCVP